MEPILQRISRGEVLVADGAMGTLLFERGLKPGYSPEEMNLSHPEVLADIARLYLEAGSDIVQTNTFGGSPLKLSNFQLQDRTEEINRVAVEVVRRETAGRAYVSGSCGPTGCLLKPYGDTEPEEMLDSFRRQLTAMLAAGPDVICVETMSDLQEATLAIRAAREISAHIPIMATMTFDKTPRGFFTMMGVNVPTAVAGLLEAGADIVGSNCGNGLENMIALAREFRRHTERPLLIQSNAGLPESRDGQLYYTESPEYFGERVAELLAAGVAIIGGCCGTTPAHIRAIRQAVDRHYAK
jgi:5-methyltetrahydrofolate--homocysteine methyltransferase